MKLRPGLVVKNKSSEKFFVLLYERRVEWLTDNGLNWRMLDLDEGRLTGEFPSFLLSGRYELLE